MVECVTVFILFDSTSDFTIMGIKCPGHVIEVLDEYKSNYARVVGYSYCLRQFKAPLAM